MRRFLAYIVMMLTVVCALIFNTQAVLDQKTDAMEFGSGTEMYYSITKREASSYSEGAKLEEKKFSSLQDIDIESAIMSRLDLAGVRNADVKIVKGNEETQEGYQLRIALSPLNESELGRVKEVVGITGSLSMGTIGDDTVMYASANQLFDYSDTFSKIVYNGTTPYPTIKVTKEDYDTLKEKAKEASEAHKNDSDKKEANRYYAEGGEESTEEDNSTTVYLWTNKTKDDTYNKAFGTDDTIVQDEVKNKVIAKIDLNNYDSDTGRISITSNMEGESFDISSARAFVNMLNGADYGFDIEFLYQNMIPAVFGSNNRGIIASYIVLGALLVVIIALLICFYGFAGITASLTLLCSVLTSFFLFSVLGFEFSVAALVSLAILMCQSVLISLNYFERVKREINKKHDLEKANKEGYHKSFFGALDSSVVLLLVSLFSFLIAVGSYKTFFGVIMVGSIFTFIITNYVNKWMMYWLCNNIHDDGSNAFFGLKKKKERKQHQFVGEKKKLSSKLLWILPLVLTLGLGAALPTSYLLSKNDSFFNNSKDFSSGYTLNIKFQGDSQSYDKLSTKEIYLAYLSKIGTLATDESFSISENKADKDAIGFAYDPSSAFVNIVEKKDEEGNKYYNQYFTVNVDRDLNQVKTTNGSDIVTIIYRTMESGSVEGVKGVNGDISFAGFGHYINDSLTVGCYTTAPTNVAHNYTSMIMLVFLLSCFAAVYLLFRYGFSLNIAMTVLINGTLTSALGILALVLFRIPFTSYTGFGILAAVTLFDMLSVILLSGNNEVLKERGIKKTASNEERADICNEVTNRSLVVSFPCFVFLAVFGIGMFFINPALMGLSISMILFSVFGFLMMYFYAAPLYYFFATHISFKKLSASMDKWREKHGKKKEEIKAQNGIVYVDQDGPHETIIPGVNDFHH